ncbi:hypothetical protein N431DRAFT_377376 [Stipitochalara longipes BDJ]|nr:hypothetical protein N431DRAFT_377376 [Stipitochalara longipes BDJ]
MPRPFPFPFNIGTDICSIDRVFSILKGPSGRRFVRRILNEKERHEGLERLDAPLERWKLAGRVGSVLEWKRKELGLSVRELDKRRYKSRAQAGGPASWVVQAMAEGMKEDGGGGKRKRKKIRTAIREELRRELEREIRAEEEVERKLKLEEGEKGIRDDTLLLEREYVEMQGEEIEGEVVDEESAVVFRRNETERSSEAADKKKELEVRKDEQTSEHKKQKRLDDVDIMLRLLHDHEKELETAAEGLWSAAEFLAGRFAAKEAAIKAHHYRKLTYHSIAIHRPPGTEKSEGSQPPVAVILPDSGDWEQGQEAKISISHDGEYATATCLAFEARAKGQSDPTRKRQSTGAISETRKHTYTQLEMDDMDSEEEEDKNKRGQTEAALQENDRELTGIYDPSRLVKVERLSDDVTAEDLLELFKGKSEKLKVHIVVAADGKRRGYAFVSFANSREAAKAREETDLTLLKGKKILCRWMGATNAMIRGVGTRWERVFKGEEIGP